MTDRGLQEAIRAAGGVTELARRIGISQPSVSNWSRIPAERVLSVEAITGVTRDVLRPDLYSGSHAVENIEAARAQEYALLATLLLRAPTKELLARIGELHGDATPVGVAHIELAAAARDADVQTIEQQFFDVFIGIGRGELLPYGSYYLTGFLHERPLARLRQDMAEVGVARAEGVVEPEDHAGILCEIMAGLASGELPAGPDAGRKIFEKHMAPWVGRFFADLERVQTSDFYRRVGTVGRLFIEIETNAFALPEPAHAETA
jgi:TorA maturation chaperone TorD